MQLQPAEVSRIEQFLTKLRSDVYPEPDSQQHEEITEGMLAHLFANHLTEPPLRALDVGCGQGVALRKLVSRCEQVIGVTLDREDAEACRAAGFDVLEMDQSFLRFPDQHFDLLWCRHCLEHSAMPYYTLGEFWRVLQPQGWLYVEVPAPDTSCAHQFNRNHYSVLPKSMWCSLMERTGFDLLEILDISLSTPAGPDQYWAFVLRKSKL